MLPALLKLLLRDFFVGSAMHNYLVFWVFKSTWTSLLSGASPQCCSSLSNAAHECHWVQNGICTVIGSKIDLHIRGVHNHYLFPRIGVEPECLCDGIENGSAVLYPNTI